MQDSTHYIGSIAGQEPLVAFASPQSRLAGARWVHPSMEVDQVCPPTHVLMLHCGGSIRVERHIDGRLVASGSRLGTVGIMSAGSVNRWVMQGPAEVLHLYVPPREPGGQGLELTDCFARDDPWLAHMMGLIQHEIAGSVDCSQVLLLDELERALHNHLRTHYGVGTSLSKHSLPRNRGGLAAHALRRVTQAMDDEPERAWRLADLAALACVSPDHLIRAFRQSTGTTPHRYLMHRRLTRAMELFKAQPQRSVASIAKSCGFESEAYFATAFRKMFGLRPSAFRSKASL